MLENTSKTLLKEAGTQIGLIQEYTEQQEAYLKLMVAEKFAGVFSGLIGSIVFLSLAGLSLLFGGLALGFYLGELLDSQVKGFLMTMGIFTVLLLITYLLRKTLITNPVLRKIVQEIDDE